MMSLKVSLTEETAVGDIVYPVSSCKDAMRSARDLNWSSISARLHPPVDSQWMRPRNRPRALTANVSGTSGSSSKEAQKT